MKVFYCKGFEGRCPVPTAAVVVAESIENAKVIFELNLSVIGLTQNIQLEDIIELDCQKEHCIILSDGDY